MSTTSSWTCNASASWRHIYGGWRTDNNYVYQGQWSGYGRHKGLWFFNDAGIRSTLSGRTILSARLRLTRRSQGGASSAQTPTIRRHNYSSQPSGEPSFLSGTVTSQSWGWGDTKWVTIPVTWANSLRDGSARGFAIYIAADSPYMIFNGSSSAILEITHEPSIVAPPTPTGFSIGTVTTTSAALSWNSVSTADRYRYTNQQLNPTGSTNEYTTTGTSVTNSAGISSNRRYRWRVRAENSAGVSSYTSYITRTTLPTTPSGLTVTPRSGTDGETGFNLSWNAIAGTETSAYRVDREGGGTDTSGGSTTSLTWTGLSPNTTYRFRVRAENVQGNSAYSSWVSGTTKLPLPETPDRPAASNVTKTSLTLSWSAATWASTYTVRQNGLVIATQSATSIDISGLTDGETYDFDVRSNNATGSSAYSTLRTVTLDRIHQMPEVPTGLTVNPGNVVAPPGPSFAVTASPMDSANEGLTQTIRWAVERFNAAQGVWVPATELLTTVGGWEAAGLVETSTDTETLGLPGPFRVRARAEHDGDEDPHSAWTLWENFFLTRIRVWDGTEWVPRRAYRFNGTDWDQEVFPQARGASGWR